MRFSLNDSGAGEQLDQVNSTLEMFLKVVIFCSFVVCLRSIIFCIVIGLKKLRFISVSTLPGQTVHFMHCKRIPQQAKIRSVAESATLLLFFDLLRCFEFNKQIPKTLYRSKSLHKKGFAESATVFAESRIVCGIHKQIIRHLYTSVAQFKRNPQIWNPHFVCGFRLHICICVV